MSMKWEDKGIKAPLARARGLGASRSVVDGWISLRVSAIANAIAAVWFIWFVSVNAGASHAEFTQSLSDPRNAIMMILFIVSGFYHAIGGSREIVEDYIHSEGFKIFKLVGMYLFFFAAGVASVFSVLKIAFTVGM